MGASRQALGDELQAPDLIQVGRAPPAERAAAIEIDLRKVIVASITIAPRWVRVVPRHWIVKSTAGKISRADTRRKFLDERFQPA